MDIRHIGQLFYVGIHGTRFAAGTSEFLSELNPSGVILFSRNVESPVQISELCRDLQSWSHDTRGFGLFIGVDQEGGRVNRLKEGFTVFPAAMESVGSANPEQSIREFAQTTARELRLCGINQDFVPLLDVLGPDADPATTVIGDRAFGRDPETVWRFGRIVIDTMRAGGVIPCCKHFPGHGGTAVDSHVELPTDARDRSTIELHDVAPFRHAVNARIETIMTAHVLYPALDGTLPATLSHAVITGLLRQRLGYDGIVITDDLDMGAVARHHSPEESSTMAVQAGVDLLLVCNNPEKAFGARSALWERAQDGTNESVNIRESLRRIEELRAKYAGSTMPVDANGTRAYFSSLKRRC